MARKSWQPWRGKGFRLGVAGPLRFRTDWRLDLGLDVALENNGAGALDPGALSTLVTYTDPAASFPEPTRLLTPTATTSSVCTFSPGPATTRRPYLQVSLSWWSWPERVNWSAPRRGVHPSGRGAGDPAAFGDWSANGDLRLVIARPAAAWPSRCGSGTVTDPLLGVDIGTSDTKVLATTLGGQKSQSPATPHPMDQSLGWPDRDRSRGAGRLGHRADGAGGAGRRRPPRCGPVAAAWFAGIAEAGVLLDRSNRPVAPIIAWFDPRGGAEIAAAPETFRVEFASRTGLPCNAMATVGKLLWMKAEGLAPHGGTWSDIPNPSPTDSARCTAAGCGSWPAVPGCWTRGPPTSGRPPSNCSAPDRV